MKHRIILLFAVLFAVSLQAQISFVDDFESYSSGDLIAQSSPDWTTWSGGGTADDTNVSDEQAFSGVNSLRFYSESTNGGPADVVLPFGGKYVFGNFHFEMQMFIVPGADAYFNFQGEEVVGQTFPISTYFTSDGKIEIIISSNDTVASEVYPAGEWFNLSVDVDLTNNNWVVTLNGTQVAEFSNPVNAVASLDLFPVVQGEVCHFYVDDVMFSHEPPILLDSDVGMESFAPRTIGMTGKTQNLGGMVRNLGLTPLTSFDVTFSDGITQTTESISGLNIPPLGTGEFSLQTEHQFADGSNSISLTAFNPNGMVDGNTLNNTLSVEVTGYTPHPDKKVLIEEITGTWCTWCPRGIVFMDLMEERYPDHFVGVAVHAADPMALTADEYEYGLFDVGLSSFPRVGLERRAAFDPRYIEENMLPRLTDAPLARLTNVITDFNVNGDLVVTVQAEFFEAVSGDFRLNAIVIENGVTGTGSGYAQVNAYSGGGEGPMGGFENLPDPVPASMMVYDKVARALLGGFEGVANSLPSSIAAGETHEYTFTYTLDNEVDPANIEVVGILLEPNGTINNVTSTGPSEFLTSTRERYRNDVAEVYPNPFSTSLNIRLALPEATNVEMIISNAMGETVATRSYGLLLGDQLLHFDATGQASGVYFVHLKTDNYLITKKVQLVK